MANSNTIQLIIQLVDKASSEITHVRQSLEKFGEVGDGLKDTLKELIAGFTVVEIVRWEAEIIKASGELLNFSQSTGIAVEKISALQFAAKSGGVGAGELNSALKTLNNQIADASGNGKSNAATAFEGLGISLRDSSGKAKDASQIFNDLADVFKRSQDGPNKVAYALQLLGRAGESLIPTLNKGSDGLSELQQEAQKLGAIIGHDTAEAANEFNDKLDLLKLGVDGVGIQIEKALLPILNELAQEFINTAKDGDQMRILAEEVTAAFKLLISSGLAVKEAFSEVGNAIGGAFAAANAAIHGNFSEAKAILDDNSKQTAASFQKTMDQINGIWDDGLREIVVTGKKINFKDALPNLSSLEAFKVALKSLQDFANGVVASATNTNEGTRAAVAYKIAHLEMAPALLKSRDGLKAFQDAMRAATDVDTKEATKQIADLKAQLDSLGGNEGAANLAKFDQQIAEIGPKIKGLSQEGGFKDLATQVRAQIDLQGQYNNLLTESSDIQAQAQRDIDAVNRKFNDGQITSIETQKELDAIYRQESETLKVVADQLNVVAAASTDPKVKQAALELNNTFKQVAAQSGATLKQVRSDIENDFSNQLTDAVTHAKTFRDATLGFLKDIETEFVRLIAKKFAEQLFGSSGFLGGLVSAIAGAGTTGGGGRAGGGYISGPTIVGEDGPELFIPGTSGTIANKRQLSFSGGGGGGGINYNPIHNITIVSDDSKKTSVQLAQFLTAQSKQDVADLERKMQRNGINLR